LPSRICPWDLKFRLNFYPHAAQNGFEFVALFAIALCIFMESNFWWTQINITKIAPRAMHPVTPRQRASEAAASTKCGKGHPGAATGPRAGQSRWRRGNPHESQPQRECRTPRADFCLGRMSIFGKCVNRDIGPTLAAIARDYRGRLRRLAIKPPPLSCGARSSRAMRRTSPSAAGAPGACPSFGRAPGRL
jgi:hypothetical protein